MKKVYMVLGKLLLYKQFIDAIIKNNADSMQLGGRFMTVSYTHLDVYKRQMDLWP